MAHQWPLTSPLPRAAAALLRLPLHVPVLQRLLGTPVRRVAHAAKSEQLGVTSFPIHCSGIVSTIPGTEQLHHSIS